jgi:hypothetical protein
MEISQIQGEKRRGSMETGKAADWEDFARDDREGHATFMSVHQMDL